MGKTLYEKVYDAHVVYEADGELPLIYIDRHLVHEVTSPQAFAGLKEAGRKLRRPELMMATMDHDISTQKATIEACSCVAKKQVTTLMQNCKDFGVTLFGLGDPNQGIVHIIGPQTGFTLPGTTLVCGDSHTATHGAFGALAFGIGTSEVEHVMATQTIKQAKLKTMRINCVGKLPKGVFAKDLILEIARVLTTAGATGYAIEFAGDGVTSLSMDARMTLSNMAIEIGAKAGMIAPDETTFEYLKGRPYAPKGKYWDDAVQYWKSLATDADAVFDKEITIISTIMFPILKRLRTNRNVTPLRLRSSTLKLNLIIRLKEFQLTPSSLARAQTGALRTSEKQQRFSKIVMLQPAYVPWLCRALWQLRHKPKKKVLTKFSKTPVLNGVCPAAPCASA